MNYWLIKTEPTTWSWDNQVKAGVEPWDGVHNAQALNNMRQMQVGDRCFFYHSVKERAIVGIVEVVKTFYPNPKDPRPSGLVDVKTVVALDHPVNLDRIKASGKFQDLALIRQSRLSVMPVPPVFWNWVLETSNHA